MIGEVWNADRDPIGVSFEVKEKIHPAKLISSDNTLFSKVMTVFSVVMCEIEEMSKLVCCFSKVVVNFTGGEEVLWAFGDVWS